MKDRLKELRKKLGLKQREVAERLGVNVGLIGTWESGGQAIPKTRIYQLCKEYNVNEEWFKTGIGEMFAPSPDKISEEQAQENFICDVFDRLTEKQQERILKALRKCVASQERETISPVVNVKENNGTINQFNK